MHTRLAEVADYLESTRSTVLGEIDGVAPERLTATPAAGGWSAAQILDHLQRVEGICARVMGKALSAAISEGLGPEDSTESLLDSLDRFRITLTDTPLDAPDSVVPHSAPPVEELVPNLRATRDSLRSVLRDANGLAIGTVILQHPRLGQINLYQWALFVAQHERRHVPQLQRALGRS